MSAYEIPRLPARLETRPGRVWFRSGNDVHYGSVFCIWGGLDYAAISVATDRNPDGATTLVTLADLALLRDAIEETLTRAGNE